MMVIVAQPQGSNFPYSLYLHVSCVVWLGKFIILGTYIAVLSLTMTKFLVSLDVNNFFPNT